jgi:hypothetical protein
LGLVEKTEITANNEREVMEMKISKIREAINQKKTRSAWDNGVREYALELLDQVEENQGIDYELYGSPADKKELLNGASNWTEYSWGGSSLIYNEDIAKRLSSPSELKKTKNGERRPNAREEWLDTQARALYQATMMIFRIVKGE